MSSWHGRQMKGAAKIRRLVRRQEAEDRVEITAWERTREYRRLQRARLSGERGTGQAGSLRRNG
jgi:hypothetical protein